MTVKVTIQSALIIHNLNIFLAATFISPRLLCFGFDLPFACFHALKSAMNGCDFFISHMMIRSMN